MSQEPIDFEAERRRAAKELGLPYSDLDDPVHWQRNMQTQEAKKELAEMLSRTTRRRRAANHAKTSRRMPRPNQFTPRGALRRKNPNTQQALP